MGEIERYFLVIKFQKYENTKTQGIQSIDVKDF